MASFLIGFGGVGFAIACIAYDGAFDDFVVGLGIVSLIALVLGTSLADQERRDHDASIMEAHAIRNG